MTTAEHRAWASLGMRPRTRAKVKPLAHFPRFQRDEEAVLLDLLKHPSPCVRSQARDALLYYCIPIAGKKLWGMAGRKRGLLMRWMGDDLMQALLLAAVRAFPSYQRDRGARWTTYAARMMERAFGETLRQAQLIRPSNTYRATGMTWIINDIHKAKRLIRAINPASSWSDEYQGVAHMLGIDAELARNIYLDWHRPIVRVEELSEEEEPAWVGPSPEDAAVRSNARDLVREANEAFLDTLNDTDKATWSAVVYPALGRENQSDYARRTGVTRAAVSARLARLKQQFRSLLIHQFGITEVLA